MLAPKWLLKQYADKNDFGPQKWAYQTALANQSDLPFIAGLQKGLNIVYTVAAVYGVFRLGASSLTNFGADNGAIYNFGKTAALHMENANRAVPVQILDMVIKNTEGLPDPEGSNALMHYSEMWRNGKLYNLEVLYDKSTNSIWHFQYGREAMGPLQAISK